MRNVARRALRYLAPGVGLGAGGGIGAYLLQDEFTTDRAAGAVDGTAAEPGPGTRISSGLAISDGAAVASGISTSLLNPGISIGDVARTPGRILLSRFLRDSSFGGGSTDPAFLLFNFLPTTTWTQNDGGFLFAGGNLAVVLGLAYGTGLLVGVASANNDTYYKFLIAQRSAGSFYFIEGKLAYVTNLNNTATLRPAIGNITGGRMPPKVDYMRAPVNLWLPTPLASDGFGSAFGTTDGLGHAEGIAGGLGSGGGGLTWTQNVGTWTVASGKAQASALSGGVAVATVNAGNDDVFAMLDLTRSAGNIGMVLRYTDENNNIICRHNGTNVQVVKTVAGTPTTLIDVAATYSAGATLAVSADATTFRIYYNNAFIGSEQTISDAALQAVNAIGLRTTNTGNTFDNFRVWAKGTNGEYSVLDQY